jgi:polyisoprenoid-binding protein YceI
VINARSLVIDDDWTRRLARLGRGPSQSQRADIQAKMLDADHLNVAEFPEMRFESVSVATDDWRTLQIEGRLSIRGVTQNVAFPASLQVDAAERITFAADIPLKQTAFGIKPESIAGVVKVSDPVDLHIRLVATRTAQACR